MKKLFKIITVLVLALGIAGCGSKTNKVKVDATEGSTEGPIVTIVVKDYGTMTFQLFDDVPNTVKNFVSLANQGYYNGLTFHRLVKDFMIQGGDPEGTGMGGPGYSIKGEFNKNKVLNTHKHHKGAIAMARSNGNNDSAGSQFYIVFDEQACKSLDGDYAVFGQLISGEDVLDKLNNAPLMPADPETGEPSEQPDPQIIIESITVDTKGVDYGEPEKIS